MMAFEQHTADDITYIAESFKEVADKLFSVAKTMQDAKLPHLTLQLKSVRDHYLNAFEKMVSDVEMHLKNQVRCAKTGETPLWEISVRKSAYNKALREASVANKRYARKPETEPASAPAKKATKKRSTKH